MYLGSLLVHMALVPFSMCMFMEVVVVAMVCMFMAVVVVAVVCMLMVVVFMVLSMFMGPTEAPAASCLLHLLPHCVAALLLLLQLLRGSCLQPGLVDLHINSVR